MNGTHTIVDSSAMGRGMHLWRFGHWGTPLLVMPSAAGIAHEWEYNGLIAGLAPLIEAGLLKLYCTESNCSESWTYFDGDPVERLSRHRAFESYVTDELVPWIRTDCRTPSIRIAAAGTSLGAFYSANLVLKYPELFFYGLCLSGRYDASWLTDGYADDDVYYNSPLAFVPNLDGDELARVRDAVHLDLVCGRGAHEGGNIDSTRALADALDAREIPHRLDLWGREVGHEPHWWTRQAKLYLSARFSARPSSPS